MVPGQLLWAIQYVSTIFFFLSAYFSKDWKYFTRNPNLIFVNDKNIDALPMGIFLEGRWSIHGCFSYLSELLICAEDL